MMLIPAWMTWPIRDDISVVHGDYSFSEEPLRRSSAIGPLWAWGSAGSYRRRISCINWREAFSQW